MSFEINSEYRIYGIAAKLQNRKKKNQNQKPKRPFEEVLKDQEDKPESSSDSAVRLDIKG